MLKAIRLSRAGLGSRHYLRLNSTSMSCQYGTGFPALNAGENLSILTAVTASAVSPCPSPERTR